MALFSRKKNELPNRRRSTSSYSRPAPDDLEQRYNFRRNQTLTGSTSLSINAAAEHASSHLKSARTQAHELTRQRRHIGLSLLGVLVVLIGLTLLVWQFTASVSISITNADPNTTYASMYVKSIQNYLNGQPFQRLRFLLNQGELQNYLEASSPEISHVTVKGASGFGGTSIAITVRKPIAVWDIHNSEEYVDSQGISFERNYFSTPSVQIIDESGVELPPGQAVASSSFFSFVGRLVGFSDKRGLTVQQVIIPQGTTHQVQLRVNGISYPIIFSIDRPAGDQVEDMSVAITWFRQHQVTPSKYLDVRVSGRAYYM